MDVLIKGLSLPKEPKLLLLGIDEFGNVCRVSSEHLHFKGLYNSKAIELPPHGELVQRSDILRLFDENKLSAREAVMKAPTIVEATNG